ncbi:AAA family ATPase [Vibrio hangzhouensis]|uniref:AAA family ATPase n=1 Tax=Vibrio hangzhouensis TaxID=462991 RepID=UPI001C95B364|nr:AAA family ATPase [Vibrio hangzhouensis]MBY6196601.1 AAA family ATPase [Vibrio hangzhouensis]
MVEPIPIKNTSKEIISYSLKTALNVWVFYVTETFRKHINSELSRCKAISIEHLALASISEDAISALESPDVILVEGKNNWASKVSELHDYDFPTDDIDASLVVFGNESDSESLKLAIRIGASDFVSEYSSIAELLPLFQTIADQKVSSRHLGELLVFLNTKGGNGATTIAMNTAIQLAERYPNDVLLIDIDTQFGLLPEYLDLKPKYTMFDVFDEMPELDESALNSMVIHYREMLHTIGFGRGHGQQAIEKIQEIQTAIPLLRRFYKYIVIDFSRGIDPVFASLLPSASTVFVLLQQNYMSLKNAGQIVKSLKLELGVNEEALELIVNRYEKSQSIALKDIESTLPNITTHLIPNDFKGANESANLGKPIVNFKKKSAISKAIVKLAESVAPEEGSKKGWFSRLFS